MKGLPRTGASSASSERVSAASSAAKARGVGGVGGGVLRVGLAPSAAAIAPRGGGGVLRVEPEVAVVGGSRRPARPCSSASACGSNGPPARIGSVATPGASSSVTSAALRRQRGDRAGEPGGEGGADPDDEIRLLEQRAPRTGAARSRARGAGRHDQLRRRRRPAITRAAIEWTGAMSVATRGAAPKRRPPAARAPRRSSDQPAHCSFPLPRAARHGPCRGWRRRLGCRSDPVALL